MPVAWMGDVWFRASCVEEEGFFASVRYCETETDAASSVPVDRAAHRLATAFPPFISLHHFLQSVHRPDICFGFCPYHAIYSFSVQCIFRSTGTASCGARQDGMQPIHNGGELLDHLRVSNPEFVERPGLLYFEDLETRIY